MRTIHRVRDNFGSVAFRTSDPLTAGAYAAASNGRQTVTHTPTKFEIELLKARGYSEQAAREEAAATAGIYGVAFFGHRGGPEDRRILSEINKKISEVY